MWPFTYSDFTDFRYWNSLLSSCEVVIDVLVLLNPIRTALFSVVVFVVTTKLFWIYIILFNIMKYYLNFTKIWTTKKWISKLMENLLQIELNDEFKNRFRKRIPYRKQALFNRLHIWFPKNTPWQLFSGKVMEKMKIMENIIFLSLFKSKSQSFSHQAFHQNLCIKK
jgi:hypothetical protein